LSRIDFSLKTLLIAVILLIIGILLMFESSNMLFQMNPLSIAVMMLAGLLIFSGIVLIILSVAAMASI